MDFVPVAGLNSLHVSAFAGFKPFMSCHSRGNGGGVVAGEEHAGAAGVPVGVNDLKHTREFELAAVEFAIQLGVQLELLVASVLLNVLV